MLHLIAYSYYIQVFTPKNGQQILYAKQVRKGKFRFKLNEREVLSVKRKIGNHTKKNFSDRYLCNYPDVQVSTIQRIQDQR